MVKYSRFRYLRYSTFKFFSYCYSWVDGALVPIGSSIRYLGLELDAGWTFRGHFDRLLTHADRMVAALNRLMPNLEGRAGDAGVCTQASSSPFLWGPGLGA